MRRIASAITLVLLLAASAEAQQQGEQRPGIGVDRFGGQVIDPTKNVADLVNALKEAIEQNRIGDQRYLESQLSWNEKINTLRYQHSQDLALQRADFDEKLRALEKSRLDAIRTVDQGSIAIASERAVGLAANLQKTLSDTAEVLRTQGQKNSEETRQALASAVDSLSKRITALETSGSEVKGRSGPQDPNIAALVQEVQKLSQSQITRAGTDTGRGDVFAWISGGLGVIFGIGGLTGVVIAFAALKRTRPARR